MSWTTDDAGDLINLDHIELITVMPLQKELQGEEADSSNTHELLAINPDQESYRLTVGTEEDCKRKRASILVKFHDRGELAT